jgi:hypothetical protein
MFRTPFWACDHLRMHHYPEGLAECRTPHSHPQHGTHGCNHPLRKMETLEYEMLQKCENTNYHDTMQGT